MRLPEPVPNYCAFLAHAPAAISYPPTPHHPLTDTRIQVLIEASFTLTGASADPTSTELTALKTAVAAALSVDLTDLKDFTVVSTDASGRWAKVSNFSPRIEFQRYNAKAICKSHKY